MKQTPRTRKLGETIREVIAKILIEEISDPRIDFVTVTGVQVSPDIMQANVYVTAHGGQEVYDEVLAGLTSASGRIRSLVGKRIKARFTPELHFFIDESVDAGMQIGEALKNVPPTLTPEAIAAREAAELAASEMNDEDSE